MTQKMWRIHLMRCNRCGEHWDLDSIHEEVSVRWPHKPWNIDGKHNQTEYEVYFRLVIDDFRKRGCVAIGGDKCEITEPMQNRVLATVIASELGNDIDAIIAETGDAESMGLFD